MNLGLGTDNTSINWRNFIFVPSTPALAFVDKTMSQTWRFGSCGSMSIKSLIIRVVGGTNHQNGWTTVCLVNCSIVNWRLKRDLDNHPFKHYKDAVKGNLMLLCHPRELEDVTDYRTSTINEF